MTEAANSQTFFTALPELLRLLSGDLDEAVVAGALEIVRGAVGASRAYLLQLVEDRKTLRLVGEARDGSVAALEEGFEYPAEQEAGWESVSDENWTFAPDASDPETVARYHLNASINEALGVKSIYVVRFAAEGSNWGSLGVTFEGAEGRTVDESEWKFIVTAANMIQLAIVRDVRLRALEVERDRARAAEEARSFFFSTVSHDIRTPLNAIIGYAELLKLGIDDVAERRKALDSVLVSGRTLLSLINDVLDLSKLESGKMEILPEPVDVMKLVEDVGDAFRASLGQKPVKLRLEVSPMPWLKLDPQRVRQILFNLVGNAVKFTAKGYIKVKATYERTDAAAMSGTFQMEVSDSGCGISEEDQLRIAQPYVQVGNSTNRTKGTGLGLAICRQLVMRMGGSLELQSLVGYGSTFYVTIPDVPEEDAARRARLSATQRIRFAVSGVDRTYNRVLVVDDQPMNQMVLKTMLTRFGVGEIVLANNGREALETMKGGAFDLVLTDMWMPELDGEGLVREIRRNPEWADLPVYAVTADVEAQKDHAALGFTGLLLKPLTLEKLKEVLKK